MKNNKFIFCLFCLFLFAFFLRLIFLGKVNLWLDEGCTLYFSTLNIKDLLFTVAREDNHPPLYYLILHFWGNLGKSEFILRFPSALFGALIPVLTVIIGKKFFSSKTAWISGILTSVSSFMLLFSREARMYSLITLLLLVSFYLLNKALEENNNSSWLAYSFTLTLSFYTYYLSILLLIVHGFYVILNKKFFKKWLIFASLSFILFLPWAIYFYFNWSKFYYGHTTPPWSEILEAFYVQTYGFTVYFNYMWEFHILSLLGFSLFFKGCFNKAKKNYLLVPFTFLFFFAVIFLVAYYTKHKIWEARYLYIVSPFFWLTLSNGILSIRSKYIKSFMLGFVLILNFVSFFNLLYYPEWQRENWRYVAEWLKKKSGPNDIIILEPSYSKHVLLYYYKEKNVNILPLGIEDVKNFSIKDLKHYKKIIFVRFDWWAVDPENKIEELLKESFFLKEEGKTINRNPGSTIFFEIFEKLNYKY